MCWIINTRRYCINPVDGYSQDIFFLSVGLWVNVFAIKVHQNNSGKLWVGKKKSKPFHTQEEEGKLLSSWLFKSKEYFF